jgi:uncharacterized protein
VRARRVLKTTALALAAVLVAFVFGWVPWFLGGVATTRRYAYNDRENAGLTPASFGLPFDEVAFQARDGVALSGWWVPAPQARGTVVLVHGLNRSRIEMVKKVPFLHDRGWNALLFDLRHHGASGGAVSSFGYFEKEDAHAAVDLARSRSAGPVVLWGVSLGAATATLAAAEDPGVADHLDLARSWAWWMRAVPSWPVGPEVLFWIGRRGGFDVDAVDIRTAAGRLSGRPCLFVCNSGDVRMPSEIAFELKAAAGDRARVLVVPGHSHGGAYRDATAAYQSAVAQVLDEAGAGRLRMAASH